MMLSSFLRCTSDMEKMLTRAVIGMAAVLVTVLIGHTLGL